MALRCRFLGYEDGVKGYRVLNMATGKMQIVRTVKFMETTSTDNVMVSQESEDNDGVATEPSHGGQQPWEQKQMIPTVVTSGDVISLQRDAGETTDPEEAGVRKKHVVASSTTGTTNRQRMMQDRAQVDDGQLAIEGGQAMAATEDVSKTFQEATASADHDEWNDEKRVECTHRQQDKEVGTKTVSPAPDWLPLGVRIETKRERASGSSQGSTRCQGIFTTTGCGLRGNQCDVDTAFLYGKPEEEIYMELPEGIRELLELAEAKGEDDVVCMLLQSLYGLKQASRVWNETIDKHLKSMGFKPADADPCVYTRGEGEEECIVCLYVDDMPIASRQKTVIASVKASSWRYLSTPYKLCLSGADGRHNPAHAGTYRRVYAWLGLRRFYTV
ncbi:unnamed protein product [Phytophthora fragariaefolia]|uniref:Unnamed protein product n=1 Tax=Phytophthora fragariaefolia TaxID=1490495 RepID=A0A9W6XDI2_9STRA|nr:unnamed protein product [Phytophthora fragariaefolia]